MSGRVPVQPLLLEDCARVQPQGATRFQFRLSRQECRQLQAASLAVGVTPSELVRHKLYATGVLVLQQGVTEIAPIEDEDDSDEEIERKFQQALRQAKARTARESVGA